MGDEDERDAGLELKLLELHPHRLAELEVEGGERLVEEQHLRARRHGAGERDPLLLSAGKLRRPARREVGELHQVEHRQGSRLDLRRRDSEHPHAEGDVLRHRHVRKQGVVLKHGVDRSTVRREVPDVLPVEPDLAFGHLFEARDDAQQSGLPAPRRPEEGEELVVPDRKGRSREGGRRTVALDDAAELDRHALARHARHPLIRPARTRPPERRPLGPVRRRRRRSAARAKRFSVFGVPVSPIHVVKSPVRRTPESLAPGRRESATHARQPRNPRLFPSSAAASDSFSRTDSREVARKRSARPVMPTE